MSAVDPAYRRQGLYTRLLNEMELAVRERGGASISSNHDVDEPADQRALTRRRATSAKPAPRASSVR